MESNINYKKTEKETIERHIMYIDAQLEMYAFNTSINVLNYICVDRFGRVGCIDMNGRAFAHTALHPMQFSDVMADDVCAELSEATGETFKKVHPYEYYSKKREQLKQLESWPKRK